MPDIQIVSDGTRQGTQLIVDGKDITNSSKFKVTDIHFGASAHDDYVSISYTTSEKVETESGAQGRAFVTYRFSNDKWMNEPQPEPEKDKGIGQDEAQKVGGRILRDVSRQARARRLITGKIGE